LEGAGKAYQPNSGHEGDLQSQVSFKLCRVLLKKSVGSVINEKSILEQISNPFIINMKSSFQDREYLYMTMEYMRGGDLRYHLCFYEFFNEEQTSK
jgi:serine/threonine protein kinase